MGYPMAVNLRNGLSPDYTLLICDVNEEAIAKFQNQVEDQGPIGVVSNGFEAAKAAVSALYQVRRLDSPANLQAEHGHNNAA